MKKKVEFYVGDGTDTKSCLSKEDALSEAEKLMDYLLSNPDINVVTVFVVPSADYEMGI